MVGRNGNREPETDRVINVSYRNLKSKSITIHTRVYICISSFRIRKGVLSGLSTLTDLEFPSFDPHVNYYLPS